MGLGSDGVGGSAGPGVRGVGGAGRLIIELLLPRYAFQHVELDSSHLYSYVWLFNPYSLHAS